MLELQDLEESSVALVLEEDIHANLEELQLSVHLAILLDLRVNQLDHSALELKQLALLEVSRVFIH